MVLTLRDKYKYHGFHVFTLNVAAPVVELLNRLSSPVDVVAPSPTTGTVMIAATQEPSELALSISKAARPQFALLNVASESTTDIAARFREQTGRDAESAVDEYEAAYAANS